MLTLSQNKKIAITAVALFLVSFVGMLFFLNTNGADLDHGKVNILEVGGHGEEEIVEDDVAEDDVAEEEVVEEEVVEEEVVEEEVVEVEVKIVDKETLYREYVEDEDNPVVVMDAEGKIVFATNNACDLLEVECEDLEGESFFEFINTNDLPELVTDHMGLTNDPKLVDGIGPYRIIQEEKNILAIFKAFPIIDENGKVLEIVYSIKDITAQVLELKDSASANLEGEIAYSDLL